MHNQCLWCFTGCKNCLNSSHTDCLACFDDFVYFNNSECLRNCPVGYYNNSGVCDPCHSECKTCFDSLNTTCQTCNSSVRLFYQL